MVILNGGFMKKLLSFALLAIIAFCLPAFAAQPEVPSAPSVMNKTKMPVTFNHSTHTEYSCETCHHPVDGVATYQPCATAGCHDVMGRKDKSINSYYQAMHKTSKVKFETCVSCHKEVAGKDKAKRKELTSCKGSKCHA